MEPLPAQASVRFYGELNDHLAPDQQYLTLEKSFIVAGAVKDLIESFGVPHTEVELILINGESADFSELVQNGDRVAVYPVFESLDVSPELRVRPGPLREPKFVLDVNLGRLAGYLRMLGFDAQYRNRASDPELVETSVTEHRILLTRDRGLLMHSAVTRGYWVRATDSRLQVAEILERFDLAGALDPFTRCMACNTLLGPTDPTEVRRRIPPRAAERYDEFLQCPGCRRVYWQGSHWRRMRRWIEELTHSPGGVNFGEARTWGPCYNSPMKGKPKVIAALNEALKEELSAISQYFLHAEMCENWHYGKLGDFIRKQSIDEMKHAEMIIERILFLDGMPKMNEPIDLTIGDTVKEQLEGDLRLETEAVAMYNRSVSIAQEAGDNASRELFERLLKDEEEHVDWLEAQLHQIQEIGYERYLSQQIQDEE